MKVARLNLKNNILKRNNDKLNTNNQILKNDQVAFGRFFGSNTSPIGYQVHKMSQNSPNELLKKTKDMQKDELLNFLFGRDDKIPYYAIRNANDDQMRLYFQIAQDHDCLDEFVLYKIESIDAEAETNSKTYLLTILGGDKVRQMYNLSDVDLQNKMLKCCEFFYPLRDDTYINAQGIAHITDSRYLDGKTDAEKIISLLSLKHKKATQDLTSADRKVADEARNTLDELHKYVMTLLSDKNKLDDLFNSRHLFNKEQIFAQLASFVCVDKLNLEDVNKIDFAQIDSNALCAKFDDNSIDSQIRETLLSKKTKYGISLKERAWQHRKETELSSLFCALTDKGVAKKATIYVQDFDETMQQLTSLFDVDHGNELAVFLANDKKNIRINPNGPIYRNDGYISIVELFQNKIGNDKLKQQEFAKLLKIAISDSRVSAYNGACLLQKYESCLTPEALEEFIGILSVK